MFQCKDLLSLPALAKARVISGQDGMKNGIRWAYKAETMEFAKWVRGQELLIISTPVIQNTDFDLHTLIHDAIAYHMSGALLLTGEEYVKRIPKEVLRLSNNAAFPLMVIPWDVPLVDIFEEMGHAIAYHEGMDSDKEDLLASIIFGNHISLHALELKSQMIGYDITPPQQIFVIHLYKKDGKDQMPTLLHTEKQEIARMVTGQFKEYENQILVSCYSNNLIGMTQASNEDYEKMVLIYEKIKEKLQEQQPEWEFRIGIGKSYYNLEDLQKSFQDASKCITLAEKLGLEREVLWYEHLGFYNLLMSFENDKALKDYYNEILGNLITYDEENNTRLMETLRKYLKNGGNLQHTSEILFTHRNTIKYRIQRIEQLTGRSFHNAFHSLELYNAVLIYDFLN